MSTVDQIMSERKRKLEEWRKLGFDYASKFDRTHTSDEAIAEVKKSKPKDGETLLKNLKPVKKMCGRIMNLRDMGKLCFLRIQDTNGNFQVCLNKGVLGDKYKTFIKILDLGDFCGFMGDFFVTKHGEPTLLVSEVVPLAKTIRPLPEKFHGLTDREACYRQRYLDLTTNPETLERFKIRSKVVREIRNFLENEKFMEIETRTLQPQAGGAMAKVFETYHNAFDNDFVLRIALELDLKMAVGGGLERVYEIGKCFRNEGIDPSHLQEFTMLEWYAAYQDMNWNMDLTEKMTKEVLKKVLGKTKITVLDKNEKKVTIDFKPKFKKERFPDLIKKYAKLDMFKASRKEMEKTAKKWGISDEEMKKMSDATLLDNIYKKAARPNLVEPTFVTNYPSELKPLARPHGDGTAECFQLLVAGWEIVNSYGELIDPPVQRSLLEDQAKAKAAGDEETMDMNEEFLDAMEHGMPPMTGSGIGIDRFVTLISEQSNLRDTVLFPLMKPESKKLSTKEAEALYRSKKVIVIANEDLDSGVIANAIGQLGISIGGHSKEKLFEAKTLHDKENKTHYTDCFYPMTNLSGSQKQMAEFMEKCYDAEIQCFDFTDIMRKAHSDKQMQEGYKKHKTKDLGYLAVGAFVPTNFEKEFINKFKLFGGKKK